MAWRTKPVGSCPTTPHVVAYRGKGKTKWEGAPTQRLLTSSPTIFGVVLMRLPCQSALRPRDGMNMGRSLLFAYRVIGARGLGLARCSKSVWWRLPLRITMGAGAANTGLSRRSEGFPDFSSSTRSATLLRTRVGW